MLDAMCHALSVRSAVAQVVQTTCGAGRETWIARDATSLAHAERHDSRLNRPDSPRFQTPPPRGSQIEISSDPRSFGGRPHLLQDLRQRVAEAGLGVGFWTAFPIGGGRTFNLVLHRHADDMRDLEEAEERSLRALLPHLQQAVRLSARLGEVEARAETLASVSGAVPVGLLVCDPDLSVRFRNEAANDVLARTSTLAVVLGRLRCARVQDGERLKGAMQAVTTGAAAVGRLALADEDGTRLDIRIAPTGRSSQGPAAAPAALAVTIALPDARHLFDADDIGDLFDLTPAEARLTAAMAGGASLAEYAALRGISAGTARVQLNRVLAKTATQRQAELVRIVQGSTVRRRIAAREPALYQTGVEAVARPPSTPPTHAPAPPRRAVKNGAA